MRICTVTGNKEKGVKIMPRPYLGDPKYTIEVLQKYNFAFQKRFGQNFLIDTHVLDKIITRGIDAVERQAPVVERVEHGSASVMIRKWPALPPWIMSRNFRTASARYS